MSQNSAQQEKNEDKLTTHEKYTDVYIDFLEQYKGQLSKSMKTKNGLKIAFFVTVVIVMILVVVLFGCSVWWAFALIQANASVEVVATAVVSIVSSLVTVTVAIFKLPEIVASYLFNKKEDNLMKDVISTIQKYEISAIELEVKELAKTVADSFGGENNDEAIEQSLLENDIELQSSPNAESRVPSDRNETAEIAEG